MAILGLVIKSAAPKVKALVEELELWCKAKKHQLCYEERSAKLLGQNEPGVDRAVLVKKADPIVILGGDGTLIGVARETNGESPLMLGVKFGTLGFLTELSPEELIPSLDSIFEGSAQVANRTLLKASVCTNKNKVFESQAVNDVVVQKGSRSKLLELDVYFNGRDLMRIRGDGLIFSTPTGSTAYSLAAGGSIAYPSLDVTLVTPICPHSLTYRPLILPGDVELEVRVPNYQGDVYVTVDGQVSYELHSADLVKICQANNKIRFVRSPNLDYFTILRSKLNWGIPNKSE